MKALQCIRVPCFQLQAKPAIIRAFLAATGRLLPAHGACLCDLLHYM